MRHSYRLLIVVAQLALFCSSVRAASVDFSSVNAAQVSSPAGQDFTYVLGAGPTTGVVNVRRISGDITTLGPGQSPDPNGFYVQQTGALTPVLFRFTFDQPRGFLIATNETLTALETNTFSLTQGGSAWIVSSHPDAIVSGSGSQVSFVGVNAFGPYGQFTLSAAAPSFDFLVINAPGFPYYGSAISLQVVDAATPARTTSWAGLKRLFH